MTMPVKYFAPKVIVKLCIIDFFLLQQTVFKIMNNLNVYSAHSYLYPRSRFKCYLIHHDSGCCIYIFYFTCFFNIFPEESRQAKSTSKSLNDIEELCDVFESSMRIGVMEVCRSLILKMFRQIAVKLGDEGTDM